MARCPMGCDQHGWIDFEMAGRIGMDIGTGLHLAHDSPASQQQSAALVRVSKKRLLDQCGQGATCYGDLHP